MNRANLIMQLEVDEGRRKRIYTDTVGKITAGVGRNLTDRGFSEDEINLMLNNDIDDVEHQLDKNVPWWRGMNDVRQNVLANMCFMGIGKLLGFKRMLTCMQAKQYGAAADEMLSSLWATQVGARATRLADHMRKGE